MDLYNALIAKKENSKVLQIRQDNGKVKTISGTGEVKIESVTLHNKKNETIDYLSVGESVVLRVKVKIYAPIPKLVLGYAIKDRLGQTIFGTNTHYYDKIVENLAKGDRVEYSFAFPANLGVGSYSIAIAAHADDTHISSNYEWQDQALVFEVANVKHKEFVGIAWIPPEMEISHVKS
jgi:lipopolysaccharide transport system ATP-binding protein